MSPSGPGAEPFVPSDDHVDEVPLEALAMGEAVGGLLAMEAYDDLALGDPDDYGEMLELGEADAEGAMVALDFGASDSLAGTGAWDLGEVAGLVVNERKGDFGGDGSSARDDVMVMEEEYDPDAEVVAAVWQDADGRVRLERRIKRQRRTSTMLLPYGLIAGMLLVLGGVALVGVVFIVIAALLAPAPGPVDGPATPHLPTVESDHAKIEAARKKTSEEILQEVLGEDGKQE
ncbi:MAG: hypothetical protein H6736_05165 [Alphaproteobacteria bacterium]|nr:hypothetical protein [Alphaproteobacteria bacterium]MCB9691187.1 hypothetical protein [Alphaproteobacteria bacterium]